MPNQVDGVLMRAMSGYELSRVRTERYRLPILPTIPPHPVQPHGDSSRHGHLGNAFFSTHRQMHVPTTPSLHHNAPLPVLLLPAMLRSSALPCFADVSESVAGPRWNLPAGISPM